MMSAVGLSAIATQGESERLGVVIVRAASRIDRARRRLQELAAAYDAAAPEVRDHQDTRLVLAGPELAVRTWRCARAVRERLAGEVDVRVIAYLAERERLEAQPAPAAALLERAPWNFVFAFPPLVGWLSKSDREDAAEWLLRDPADVRVLVFPESEVARRSEFIFAAKAPPELDRYLVPIEPGKGDFDESGYVDADGLLDLSKVRDGKAVRVAHAVRQSRCTLIVAPPWTGKTHVARMLCQALELQGEAVRMTDLEDLDVDLGGAPAGVRGWRASQGELVWLIDAVDEALHRGQRPAALSQVLDQFDESERLRLRLVLFARDDETPDRLVKELSERADAFRSPLTFRLLPIDRMEAARALATASGPDLTRLDHAIERLRGAGLVAWARHVPMLRAVLEAPPSITHDRLRDLVLEQLCVEQVSARREARDVPAAALLEAGARMAAVLALSGRSEIPDDPTGELAADALFGSTDEQRAWRALRHTGPLLQRTSTGLRFRQKHAEELLAARGLQKVPLDVLRPLMTDSEGRLRPEVRVVAEELARRRPHDAGQFELWAKAEGRAWPPEKAIAALKPVEELARGSAIYPFLSKAACQRLNHPEICAYLLQRVEDTSVPEGARQLFLAIASNNTWRDFVPPAVRIALDPSASWKVREQAVELLAELGTRSDRERLESLLADDAGESAGARARLLEWALADGEDPLAIARRMPPPERGLVDLRTLLLGAIERSMTVVHARRVLDGQNVPSQVARRLEERAVELLIEQPALSPEDLDRIISRVDRPELLTTDALPPLMERLRSDPAARRTAHFHLEGRPELRWLAPLVPDDAAWLLEQVESNVAPADAWGDLLVLLPRTVGPTATKIRAYVSAKHPDEFARWTREEAQRAAELAELAAEYDQHRVRPRPRPWLGDLVRETVASDTDPERRLHDLGVLCFDERPPAGVDGRFEALGELQQRAIDHAKLLLEKVEPTALPAHPGPYPSAIGIEGRVFRAVVTWKPLSGWPTPELIRRWLPSVLFALTKDRAETVARCGALDGSATEEAAIIALDAEAMSRNYATVIRELPASLWARDDLKGHCRELIRSGRGSLEFRADLLEQVARRDRSLTTQRLTRELAAGLEPQLRRAAIRAMVLCNPTAALEFLDSRWSDDELAIVLSPLGVWERDSRDRLETWPVDAVIALLSILAKRELPEPRTGVVYGRNAGEDLREIRWRLVNWLERVDRATHERVVSQIAPLNEAIAGQLRAGRAAQELSELFTERPHPPPSTRDVASAIDHAVGPHFRSVHDFAQALLGCIDALGQRSKDHVELFFASARPGERLLQSYILMRLTDLMTSRHPDKVTFVTREPKEGSEEPDFLAIAEGGSNSRLEVPIEVKWSHSKECLSALVEQLGERYVLRPGRTRGIYVVGFTGIERNRDSGQLNSALGTRAAAFGEQHREAQLDFRVLDTQRATRGLQRAPKSRKPRAIDAQARPKKGKGTPRPKKAKSEATPRRGRRKVEGARGRGR